jgi:hypothetical protein
MRISVFFVALQNKWSLSRLVLRFLDHIQLDEHTHPIGLFLTNDRFVEEATTSTTPNKHKRLTRGIRANDARDQAAANLRLRPHGYHDENNSIPKSEIRYILHCFIIIIIIVTFRMQGLDKFLSVSAKFFRSCLWLPSGILLH